MLSYQQWKMLNESVLPGVTLGLVSPHNIGIQAPSSFAVSLEESKKKAKKKMFGGEDETGDGETVEPSSEKDEPDVDVGLGDDDSGSCGPKCGAGSKKKSKKTSKKKCGADMGDEHEEEGDVEGDEGDEGKELMFSKKKSKKTSKKKMWSDEDDAAPEPDEDEDMGDEEGGEEVEDMGGEGDDEEGDDDGAALIGKGKVAGANPLFSKKKSKKSSKKKMTKEATEEEKFWTSLRSMTETAPDTKYSDGWTEYQLNSTSQDLFTPVDVDNLTQALRPEPPTE